MSQFRQVLAGILVGLASISVVAGGISASLVEGARRLAMDVPSLTPTATATRPILTIATATNQPQATDRVQITPSLTSPSLSPSPTATPTATATATSQPSQSDADSKCQVRRNWVERVVLQGETLGSIAKNLGVTKDKLAKGNCLEPSINKLIAGSTLLVPKSFVSPTPLTRKCGPPPGWVKSYTVKHGDNLYRIGLAFGVSVNQLMQANCLTTVDIQVGDKLNVPNVPTLTPKVTASRTPSKTPKSKPKKTSPPPTKTPTPRSPSATATYTSIPPSSTPTPAPPTETPTPEPTSTMPPQEPTSTIPPSEKEGI